MRKSKSLRTRIETTPPKDASQENGTAKNAASEDTSDSEDLGEDFQFGIWLRHRRIDGALNRVPPDFYAVSTPKLSSTCIHVLVQTFV